MNLTHTLTLHVCADEINGKWNKQSSEIVNICLLHISLLHYTWEYPINVASSMMHF